MVIILDMSSSREMGTSKSLRCNKEMNLQKTLLFVAKIFITIVIIELVVIVFALAFSPCRTSINPSNAIGGFELRDYYPWATDNIVVAVMDANSRIPHISRNYTMADDGKLHPVVQTMAGMRPDMSVVCD